MRRNDHVTMAAVTLFVVALSGCGGGDSDSGQTPGTSDLTTGAGPDVRTVVFEDATAATGLVFQHFSGTTGDFLFPEILGSGVALFDYDADGDLDVYLVQANMVDPDASVGETLFPMPEGQPAGSRLFRNELVGSGVLRFTDVTDEAGVLVESHGMGAVTGDYDRDGDVDLYITTLTDNVLFRNDGDGTFTDVTEESGANVPNWNTSACFLDYDRDGDLDLFVTAYVAYGLDLDQVCTSSSGNRDYCGPQNFQSERDYLLQNQGDGTFVDVSRLVGIADSPGAALGVIAADFNGDGWTDVYVANDGEANHLWMNQGGERFRETGMMSGTALNRSGAAEASMGVTSGDFDGDGDEDLFMTHLVNETNTLYANDGTGTFTDVTASARLGFGSLRMTGFGSAWFDYDNDGWLDLYIANGNVKVDEFREEASDYPFDSRNQLFHNLGDGTFVEMVSEHDPATSLSEISRGAAFGDIDNDGDVDIVLTNNSGPARLLRNTVGQDKHWVRLRLVGTTSNTDGYGAKVAVLRDGLAPLWRRVHTDGSYVSASDPRLVIGLGDHPEIDAIEVLWPSGLRERWSGLESRSEHVLIEGRGVAVPES